MLSAQLKKKGIWNPVWDSRFSTQCARSIQMLESGEVAFAQQTRERDE